MAEKKGLGLVETKGIFQVKGVVSGTEKDSFYKEITTKNDRPMRMVNFGVQFAPDATMYAGFNGMEQEYVYFSKSEKDETGKRKNISEKVPWSERLSFKKEGFRMIGVNVGITKKQDEKGKEVNDKKIMTQYDACMELCDNLVDGESVFVKGNITYNTYEGRHMTRFEPNQISLCRTVEFGDTDFSPMANFQQTIIYTGIHANEDKTKFIVDAKIVTYNTIEDAEFVIVDSNLANLFRKNLKPYWAIDVWGDISVEKQVDEIEAEDMWGSKNEMKKVSAPVKREMIITGADPTSIEKELYAESKLDEAIEKMKSAKQAKEDFYGKEKEDKGWGSDYPVDDDDDLTGW